MLWECDCASDDYACDVFGLCSLIDRRCVDDASCPDGHRCSGRGWCTPLEPLEWYPSCTQDEDCPHWNECWSSGRCGWPQRGNSFSNLDCESERDCGLGRVCAHIYSESLPQSIPSHITKWSVCVDVEGGEPAGATCQTGYECASGKCDLQTKTCSQRCSKNSDCPYGCDPSTRVCGRGRGQGCEEGYVFWKPGEQCVESYCAHSGECDDADCVTRALDVAFDGYCATEEPTVCKPTEVRFPNEPDKCVLFSHGPCDYPGEECPSPYRCWAWPEMRNPRLHAVCIRDL